jgi:acid phosphatase (class A)
MKQSFYIIGGILVILVIVATDWGIKNSNTPKQTLEQIWPTNEYFTFSNTQEWDTYYDEVKKGDSFIVTNIMHIAELQKPPENDSAVTKNELAFLNELIKERTPEKIAEIESEVEIYTTIFGGETYLNLTEKPNRTQTKILLEGVLADSLPPTLKFKDQFNRVRPNVLDETISIVVPVPGHPAYPSGHATQSYILALILGKLNPDKAGEYINDSLRIAHNREIGGLHYPSDSDVGRVLAQQYFDALIRTQWYKTQFQKAKIEW